MKTILLLMIGLVLGAVKANATSGDDFIGNNDSQFYNQDASDMIRMHKAMLKGDHDPVKTTAKSEYKENEIPTPLEEENARKIQVFPNPCTVSVKVSGVNAGDHVYIVSETGQMVLSFIAETNDPQIDVSHLQPGLYIIGIQNAKEITRIEFIK